MGRRGGIGSELDRTQVGIGIHQADPRNELRKRWSVTIGPEQSERRRDPLEWTTPSPGPTVAAVVVWGQAAVGQPAGSNPVILPELRWWLDDQLLAHPDPIQGVGWTLSALAIGLAGLLLPTLIAQRTRGLTQVFDVSGHLQIVRAALRRLLGRFRSVGVLFLVILTSWTFWQFSFVSDSLRALDHLEDLKRFASLGSPWERALEQGLLSALMPHRVIGGLSHAPILSLLGAIMMFQAVFELQSMGPRLSLRARRGVFWMHLAWIVLVLNLIANLIQSRHPLDLPPRGFGSLETPVLAILRVLADATLLSWLAVELRRSGRLDEPTTIDGVGIGRVLPGMIVLVAVTLPGVWLAHLLWTPGATPQPALLDTQLIQAVILAQGFGLAFVAWFAVPVWRRPSVRSLLKGLGWIWREQGGRIWTLTVWAAVANGVFAFLVTGMLLQLTPRSWVLAAIAGYLEYAGLFIGLVWLACLVEVGEQALPVSTITSSTGSPARSGVAPTGVVG